ncbi:GAD-like domain-containing protein [Sutcliffiella sp. NPDC057660]
MEKYRHLAPNKIIDSWSRYGFGIFIQGYFKSVNPEEYNGILEEG